MWTDDKNQDACLPVLQTWAFPSVAHLSAVVLASLTLMPSSHARLGSRYLPDLTSAVSSAAQRFASGYLGTASKHARVPKPAASS